MKIKTLQKNKNGFTLIELLCVLVVIAIVSTIAVLAMGNGWRNFKIRALSSELHQTIQLYQEQAILNSSVYSLKFTNTGYTVLQYSPDQKKNWQVIKKKPISNKNIQFTVKSSTTPAIIISNNGNINPFKIYIGKPEQKPEYAILGAKDAKVSIEELSKDS